MARNKGFSLIEVLITAAVLSVALVFVFRSFSALLSSLRLSQNISQGCYFAERRLFEIEQAHFKNPDFSETAEDNSIFNYSYEIKDVSDNGDVKQLRLGVSWEQRPGREKHQMEFCVYLPAAKDVL